MGWKALGELFGGEAKLSVLDSFKWGYILQYNSKILIYHIGLFTYNSILVKNKHNLVDNFTEILL